MGNNAVVRADEDELCAIHLRNLLERRPSNRQAIREVILVGEEITHCHDPARPYLHPNDLEIALDIGRYEFAIRITEEDGRPVGRIEHVS
jgi:2-phosphosulfolactate phosphatase